MNLLTDLSAEQLRHAADIKEKIAALQEELSQYLSGTASAGTPGRKSRMSAEGRARIIAAQKARWAKVKAAQGTDKAEAKTKKRTMSAAAKAKIAAVARARWAKVKASGKKTL